MTGGRVDHVPPGLVCPPWPDAALRHLPLEPRPIDVPSLVSAREREGEPADLSASQRCNCRVPARAVPVHNVDRHSRWHYPLKPLRWRPSRMPVRPGSALWDVNNPAGYGDRSDSMPGVGLLAWAPGRPDNPACWGTEEVGARARAQARFGLRRSHGVGAEYLLRM